MNTGILILILAIVAILIVAAVIIARQRRTIQLKQRFGSEYDRTVAMRGDAGRAEDELAARERRVHSFPIRTLSATDRERFAAEWEIVQRRFVDEPAIAVNQADTLVNRVMVARGYPMSDFEQRAADVSVSYPGVVQNYRAARDIALRHNKGLASTEDLRQAMVHYRSLFDELLATHSNRTGVLHERAS